MWPTSRNRKTSPTYAAALHRYVGTRMSPMASRDQDRAARFLWICDIQASYWFRKHTRFCFHLHYITFKRIQKCYQILAVFFFCLSAHRVVIKKRKRTFAVIGTAYMTRCKNATSFFNPYRIRLNWYSRPFASNAENVLSSGSKGNWW